MVSTNRNTLTPAQRQQLASGLLDQIRISSDVDTDMTKSKPTAHEYLRVSVDDSGIEESQTQQHDDNEKHRKRFDWPRGRTYKDTGSASQYARKTRDDFNKMLKDLRAGVFKTGDVLQLWESSRGSREQEEWARFLNLLRDNDVFLYVTSHNRLYDLHNPRDRRSLDEDGVDSAYESAKTSLRIRRDTAAHAAKGRPHGRKVFGYKRKHDPDTGKLVAQIPHPDEAKLIAELFKRLKLRQSLRRIEKNWAARGIINGQGRPFSAQHLHSLATNPTYAGLRVHDPGRKGRKLSSTATITKGDWEPLVNKTTFFTVQSFLTKKGRRTSDARGTKPGNAVHWLSMIGKCDPCGGVLAARFRRGDVEYTCHKKGCVNINKAALDRFAETALLNYLAREDVHESLRAVDESNDAELDQVRDELAQVRAEVRDLADRVGRRQLSIEFAAQTEPGLRQRISELEQREQELSTPSVLRGLITPGEDVARRWQDCEMSTKRAIAKIVLSPELLGELRVLRSPTPGHTCPVEQRMTLRGDGLAA